MVFFGAWYSQFPIKSVQRYNIFLTYTNFIGSFLQKSTNFAIK